jgi:hypothetical protein
MDVALHGNIFVTTTEANTSPEMIEGILKSTRTLI